ncbi:MAG: hypothetical protein ACPL6F_04465, partial [Anaerolineales bacterium]
MKELLILPKMAENVYKPPPNNSIQKKDARLPFLSSFQQELMRSKAASANQEVSVERKDVNGDRNKESLKSDENLEGHHKDGVSVSSSKPLQKELRKPRYKGDYKDDKQVEDQKNQADGADSESNDVAASKFLGVLLNQAAADIEPKAQEDNSGKIAIENVNGEELSNTNPNLLANVKQGLGQQKIVDANAIAA